MNTLLENLHKLFKKYRFTEPIPGDVQKRALDSIKDNIISILRESGDYSFVFGRVLSVYLRGKRLGLKLSFLQCKIILALAALIIVSIVSATAIVLSQQIETGKPDLFQTHDRQMDGKAETGEDKRSNSGNRGKNETGVISEKGNGFTGTKKSGTEFELGIDLFSGVDRELSEKVTNSLTDKLKLRIGTEKVTLLNDQNRTGVHRIVTGSIRKLGNRYYFTSKIIHVRSGKIEYALSENIDTSKKIDRVISKTAEKIACHINKCE